MTVEGTGHQTGDVGKVRVQTSGIKVTGGVSVHSGGLWLIQDEEMRRTPLNHTVTGAVNVTGGLTSVKTVYVDSNNRWDVGLTVVGGMTIKDHGLIVPNCYFYLTDIFKYGPNRQTCWDPRGLYIGAGGARVDLGGVRVYGKMNVTGGLKMAEHYTKGVTINTGGLQIVAGGVTVNAGVSGSFVYVYVAVSLYCGDDGNICM